jgi:hypothetical protein
MADPINLQHQAIIAAEVENPDGTWLNLGTEFRQLSGISFEGEVQMARPGSMAPPEASGSTYTYGDVTMERTIRHGRDSGLVQTIMDRKFARVRGTRSPTDPRGNAGFHRPTGFEGILSGAGESDYDADGNEIHTLSLTIGVDRIG